MKENNSAFIILFLFVFGFAIGSSLKAFGLEPDKEKPLVDDKYRLTKDREEFEKLRSQIPTEKRQENDEVAFVLGLMSELKYTPNEVREKFNTALRKKRDLFNKDMKRYREDFVKSEKSNRDKFTNELSEQRKGLKNRKMSSKERSEFNSNLEAKRKEFYVEQKEKREEFESAIRDQRKNFEDYAREKTNNFNQDHRAYSKRHTDFKKEKEEERKNQNSQKFEKPSADTAKNENQNSNIKTVSPSAYGISNEDLEKAFAEAQSKPASTLAPEK